MNVKAFKLLVSQILDTAWKAIITTPAISLIDSYGGKNLETLPHLGGGR